MHTSHPGLFYIPPLKQTEDKLKPEIDLLHKYRYQAVLVGSVSKLAVII